MFPTWSNEELYRGEHIPRSKTISTPFQLLNFPSVEQSQRVIMLLRYYEDETGKRVYTLKKIDPQGNPTISAHPAKFSPADTYSRQRIVIKQRFGLLPTQQKPIVY